MTGSPTPDWLPPLIQMSPWNQTVLAELYEVFRRDFIENPPRYQGCVVWFFPERDQDKERIFWHLTEREDPPGSGNRLPDFRRCERLRWARALFDHCEDPLVKAWDYEEGTGDIRTYIWLVDFDYVVVMKRYPDGGRRLITAHFIDYDSKRRTLRRKFANRVT